MASNGFDEGKLLEAFSIIDEPVYGDLVAANGTDAYFVSSLGARVQRVDIAGPLAHGLVFRIRGIGKREQHVRIAVGPAAILGRAGAFPGQQAKCGSELAGFSIDRQFSRSTLVASAVAADGRESTRCWPGSCFDTVVLT